jgi:hypothetical protein
MSSKGREKKKREVAPICAEKGAEAVQKQRQQG